MALHHFGINALQQLLSLDNRSWQRGYLEASWKIARIVAILKPGKLATDLDSYRPIALLNFVGKAVGKMALERFAWDIAENRDLYPLQMSGCRRTKQYRQHAFFGARNKLTKGSPEYYHSCLF